MSVQREIELKVELEPAAVTSFRRDAAVWLDAEIEHIKGELRSVARLFGEARDIDVYRTRADEAWRDAESDIDELEARLDAERERAYDAVTRKLGSKRLGHDRLAKAKPFWR
jgi:CHAD domain-containing protein